MSGKRGGMSILLVIIMALALLTASCAGAPTIPMTLYESTEHGFSIEYPEGWTESVMELGVLFYFTFVNPEGSLTAMVSVEYKTEEVILADLILEGKEEMESTPQFELISEGDVTIGEAISGYEIVGKGDLGTGEVGKLRFVILARGEQAFWVGAVGETVDFDEQEQLIDAIIDSFKLLPTYTFVPPAPGEAATYTSAEYGFSIDYPAGWMGFPPSRPGEVVSLGSVEGFPGVTVSASPVGEETILAEFGPQFSQSMSEYWGDYELVSEGEITLDDGTTAYETVCSGTREGYALKAKYVVVIQGTQAFFIMGYSTPAQFEQDEAAIDEVIHSFHLE